MKVCGLSFCQPFVFGVDHVDQQPVGSRKDADVFKNRERIEDKRALAEAIHADVEAAVVSGFTGQAGAETGGGGLIRYAAAGKTGAVEKLAEIVDIDKPCFQAAKIRVAL